MKEYGLSRNVLSVWRIRVLAIFLLFIAVSAGFSFLSVWFWLIAVAAAAGTLYFCCCYFPALQKNYKIKVSPRFVSVERGVYIKTENIMPAPRYIYTQYISTPVGDFFGVCILALSAVRGKLLLTAVDRTVAEAIIHMTDSGKDRGE